MNDVKARSRYNEAQIFFGIAIALLGLSSVADVYDQRSLAFRAVVSVGLAVVVAVPLLGMMVIQESHGSPEARKKVRCLGLVAVFISFTSGFSGLFVDVFLPGGGDITHIVSIVVSAVFLVVAGLLVAKLPKLKQVGGEDSQ